MTNSVDRRAALAMTNTRFTARMRYRVGFGELAMTNGAVRCYRNFRTDYASSALRISRRKSDAAATT